MKTLALDLSTSSTGWAIFEDRKLMDHGTFRPIFKGITTLKYPEKQFRKIESLSAQIRDLITAQNPDKIVIEEVNRGINRIGQKSLDALHFMVIDRIMVIDDTLIKRIKYTDSNGRVGWRGKLGLTIAKKYPKIKGRSAKWKKVAEEFVNKKFNKKFDVIKNKTQADEVDAICVGWASLNA